MSAPTTDDAASFVDKLTSMTDHELFAAMRDLEKQSEETARAKRDTADVLARIALVEGEIEERNPGQALAPYKKWQIRGP